MVNSNKALSLVELLVSISIMLILLVGISSSFFSSSRAIDQVETTNLLQEEARVMVEVMSRDLRMAGSIPNGKDDTCSVKCEDIVGATSSKIEISRDLDGDKCCDGSGERVTYQYDPVNKVLCRKGSASDACQPFIGGLDDQDFGVSLTNFSFKYYDRDGNLTTNLSDIVYIHVDAQLVNNRPSLNGSVFVFPVSFDVTIRNRVL